MSMRRFPRRNERPARAWQDLSGQWLLITAATAAVPILRFEAPTVVGTVTSALPEDITILRMVGSFQLSLGAAVCNWTLGLMVVDALWTPGATFAADADKRVLWHETYVNSTGAAVVEWTPPDNYTPVGGVTSYAGPRACRLDITPKVKLEQGKALTLVAWENVASAAQLTTGSADMRVLYQRSGRR